MKISMLSSLRPAALKVLEETRPRITVSLADACRLVRWCGRNSINAL